MRASRILGAALLALALFVALARADPQIGGKRVALVIGNGAYRNVDRLTNAANDARLIAATLKGLDFTVVGGGALLDLNRAQLSQAVQEFGHSLAGADVGLFYYSGHGLQVQGVNWLVPVDANPTRPQDLDFQMVDADLVLRQMDGAGTKLNLVLLDACRNNPFATRGLRAVQSGLAEMRAPQGTLISYATQPGNVAADGTGANSPYTTALASSMQLPGIDIFRMFNQVGLQVKRSTGGSQQPWVSTSPIDGDFYFAGAASVPAVPQLPLPKPVPADATARLLAIARDRRCSILEARPAGDGTTIRGLALAGPDWDGFAKQVGATRGIRLSISELDLLQPFACPVIDLLGALVRTTRETERTGLIALAFKDVATDASQTVTLRNVAGAAITLDLFRPDGMVNHLRLQATTNANDIRRLFARSPGTIPGPRLLTALISPTPLNIGRRPKIERTEQYLPALRSALQTAANVRADIATFEWAPATTSAKATPPTRPPRCAAILERTQLGEPLMDDDRTFMRANCR